MSQKDVEVVWREIQAFNERDLPGAFSVWSPDAEIDWSSSEGAVEGVYHGHADLKSLWGEVWSRFETVEVRTEGFVQAGADVVIPIRAHLRGGEGIEVVARRTLVYTVENEQITRLRIYRELADALEAAGRPSGENLRCGGKARARGPRARPVHTRRPD
jgi:ketosteroid isomerase-like protein